MIVYKLTLRNPQTSTEYARYTLIPPTTATIASAAQSIEDNLLTADLPRRPQDWQIVAITAIPKEDVDAP